MSDEVETFLQAELAHLGSEVSAELITDVDWASNCQAPGFSLPRGYQSRSGRLYVGVDCGGEQRFLQAQVTVMGEYLVSAEDIPRGSVLTQNQYEIAYGDITSLLDTMVPNPEAVTGSRTKRNLKKGQVLLTRNLEMPNLVERGDRVRVETRGKGFRIALEGQAMQKGRIGDRINVRISRSRVLSAEVAGPGMAVIQL